MSPSQAKSDSARILVVDDDPNVLEVIGKLLQANGLAAECFPNADAMLASVRREDVGCVVTDLEMPGLDGIALLAKLQNEGSYLRTIVVTGHADVPRTIEIMNRGAVTLLEKPFKSGELVAIVRKAIAMSEAEAARQSRIASAREQIQRLSDEELEIMRLAARGLPNKAIALELTLSPRTVDRRRQSALAKMQIASVAEFAVLSAIAEQQN